VWDVVDEFVGRSRGNPAVQLLCEDARARLRARQRRMPHRVDSQVREAFAQEPRLRAPRRGDLAERVGVAVSGDGEAADRHANSFQRNVDNVVLSVEDDGMERKDEIGRPEQSGQAGGPASARHAEAQREFAATRHVLEAGAGALEPRPWRPAPAPPSAVDLAHFALWSSGQAAGADPAGAHVDRGQDDATLLSGLALLPAARAEVEGLEAGLLFMARSHGLTWAQIAEAMGFRSPQACQQHFARLTGRVEGRS
jgi:hypothetical protein